MTQVEWAGEMAKQMRMKKLTGRKLAELTGYTNVYISMVLGGSKRSPEARNRIERAIASYEVPVYQEGKVASTGIQGA